MPAKESVNARAAVTAGLADEVEAVKKYSAAMSIPIAAAGGAAPPLPASANTTATSVAVATASGSHCQPFAGSVNWVSG